MGFAKAAEDTDHEAMRGRILEEAKRAFRPEFINRLDDVIVFRTLGRPDLMLILELEVAKVAERIRRKNVRVVLDDKAREFLIGKGFDPQYGARPMRRAVERYLEDPLAEEILRGGLMAEGDVLVSAEGDTLTFTQPAGAAGEKPAAP
jgi:ATP-dependent Clp protease ATP-binding subunit ClpC